MSGSSAPPVRNAGTGIVVLAPTIPVGTTDAADGVRFCPIGLGITALPVRTVTMIVLIGRGVGVTGARVGAGARGLLPHAASAAMGTRARNARREQRMQRTSITPAAHTGKGVAGRHRIAPAEQPAHCCKRDHTE